MPITEVKYLEDVANLRAQLAAKDAELTELKTAIENTPSLANVRLVAQAITERNAARADAAAALDALKTLIESDANIGQATDEELEEAIGNEVVQPIIRTQASAVLKGRRLIAAANPGAALLAELTALRARNAPEPAPL